MTTKYSETLDDLGKDRYKAYHTLISMSFVNPLMPGGNKNVTHTYTSLQLSPAGLFKYV